MLMCINIFYYYIYRHSTLWELLKAKQIKFPSELTEVTINGLNGHGDDTEAEVANGVENGNDATKDDAGDKDGGDDLKKDLVAVNENLSVDDVITQMVVLIPKTKDQINAKLKNVINVLKDDLKAIERVAKEITVDASNNGVKYFEVGVDPSKFASGEDEAVSATEVVRAALRGLEAGARDTETRGCVLVQCERGRTGEAGELVTLCDNLRGEGMASFNTINTLILYNHPHMSPCRSGGAGADV